MHTESHLFSPYEQQTLVEFSNLDRHSRYLYTRIFMRKQAWLRTSSLNYGEQMVIDQSCKYLTTQPNTEPFLHSETNISSCEDALSLLLLPELKTLAKKKGIKQVSKPKEF
ncbi:Fanconi-associated nuclease 1, partial [Coemansia sp. RSA 532]